MSVKHTIAAIFFRLDSAYQARKYKAMEHAHQFALRAQDTAVDRREQAESALLVTIYDKARASMEQERANVEALRAALSRAEDNLASVGEALAVELDDADGRAFENIVYSVGPTVTRPEGTE